VAVSFERVCDGSERAAVGPLISAFVTSWEEEFRVLPEFDPAHVVTRRALCVWTPPVAVCMDRRAFVDVFFHSKVEAERLSDSQSLRVDPHTRKLDIRIRRQTLETQCPSF